MDEGADEAGKPLVRDCSCRGDTAGFAHLSCIIEYAEQKSKQAADSDMAGFSMPWEECNNCHQLFVNQVGLDLSSAFVSFAEEAYGYPGNGMWDKLKVMTALGSKITILFKVVCSESPGEDKGVLKMECEMHVKELLSMVDQTKKDLKMSGWLHMPPPTNEYQYYKMLSGDYEAALYILLGKMAAMDQTEASDKRSITYYQKARTINNLLGLDHRVESIEFDIAMLKDRLDMCDGDGVNVAWRRRAERESTLLQGLRYNYEYILNMCGSTSEAALRSGSIYATQLVQAHHGIEAERLIMKLAASSQRVHGPGHSCSMSVYEKVKECKSRYVSVMPDYEPFQALRYENGEEICVVTGPVKQPRQEEDERIFHVASDLILPNEGCPVICHGLTSASHLNGKLGDVRANHNDRNGIRLAVHFESKSLKPSLVKPENLRIAFELPKEV
jgi:hypothetical protein